MRPLLATLAMLALAAPAAAQAGTDTAVPPDVAQLALGHKLTTWFMAGQMDSIVKRMAPEVRERSGGREGLQRARAELTMNAGQETSLVEEKMTRRRGLPQYWRSAMYTNMPQEPIVLRWIFNDVAEVIGFGLGPLSSTPEPD